MKRRIICLAAALCLTLSGCSWMDGNYYSVRSHEDHSQAGESSDVSAANYVELLAALQDLIAAGKEKGIIYVGEFNQDLVAGSVSAAVKRTLSATPLGAYAVESIDYELGSNGGKPAVAVEITYLHGRTEIRKIREVADMSAAAEEIRGALRNCDASLVLQVEAYEWADLEQVAEDYAMAYPELVMEVPQVTVGIYPESGSVRILEIKFTYQNSRDVLRQMQTQVASMFEAAELYVSGDSSDYLKLSRLYGFITGLGYDFQLDTSITPAYSLLRHGVGDSKAFAVVFAAMCRQAGLECQVVTGTRGGEPRYWNIVLDGERYLHVDLLRCSELGGFREFTDGEMTGYVWDYSAYPECPEVYVPDPVAPTEETPSESTGETQSTEETAATETEEETKVETEENLE